MKPKKGIKYFRNNGTGTVHLVADHPTPRGNGFVQCGQYATIALMLLTSQQVSKRIQRSDLCGRCVQLVAEDFDECG